MDIEIKETGCCPIFNPVPWDNHISDWQDKKFIKGSVFTLFYMPITFGRVMTKLFTNITKSGATFVDNVTLSEHLSPWKMSLFLAVDKDVPGEENVTLSGKFFSKVYEGPFNDVGKWMKSFPDDAKVQGHTIEKIYAWYTTCPKCAKAYGKNYTVLFGKIG